MSSSVQTKLMNWGDSLNRANEKQQKRDWKSWSTCPVYVCVAVSEIYLTGKPEIRYSENKTSVVTSVIDKRKECAQSCF